MKTKKKKKKDLHPGILESSEVLAEQISRSEKFLEQHKTTVTVVLAVVVIAISSFFGYRYYNHKKDLAAKAEMIQAVYYFESDSLALALNGDGNNLGFIDIVDDFGSTETGNLANYYAGAIFLKQGHYNRAISYLGNFSSSDILIQARAYSLIGDAYMELAEFDNAAEYYTKAAEYKPNKYFTPMYLIKAALAYEKLANLQKAREMYQRIVDDYFDSNEAQNAKKQIARLKLMLES